MSGSNPPQPSASASAPRTRTFRPRANITRKTKAERDAHAKQEAEKAAARAAVAAQAVSQPSQGSKSAISKRKDQARDNRDNSQGASGGVFGTGTGSKPGWGRKIVDEGRSEMLEGQEGVKPADAPKLSRDETTDVKLRGQTGADAITGGGSNKSRGSKRTEDGAMVESDDEIDEPNRDIERIWISSDDDKDSDLVADSSKGKARSSLTGRKSRLNGGLRPVRAPRTLAEEQEAEAEGGTSRKMVKSNRTVVDDANKNGDEEEIEVIDGPSSIQIQTKLDIPSSPETFKRLKATKRSTSKAKDARTAIETLEERAERIRLSEDVEKLKYEFAFSSKAKKNEDALSGQRQAGQESKMFLFQFPPLIPFLDDPSTATSNQVGRREIRGTVPTIKKDPDGPSTEESAENPDATAAASELPQPQMEGCLTANEPLRLPPGRVGKLRIHKSGKVSLDWGGTDMEVRYGTEVDFLQDAVLVETPVTPNEDEEKNSGSQTGTAYTLGHVQKKMIVIPDWQKLYD